MQSMILFTLPSDAMTGSDVVQLRTALVPGSFLFETSCIAGYSRVSDLTFTTSVSVRVLSPAVAAELTRRDGRGDTG